MLQPKRHIAHCAVNGEFGRRVKMTFKATVLVFTNAMPVDLIIQRRAAALHDDDPWLLMAHADRDRHRPPVGNVGLTCCAWGLLTKGSATFHFNPIRRATLCAFVHSPGKLQGGLPNGVFSDGHL